MSSFSHAQFLISANSSSQFPDDSGTEIAFAGRSNAGKSSALNAIIGRKNLARVSKTPGRTQLVNFFTIGDHRRLVDLPGYGFARVPDAMRRHWRDLIESYFSTRQSLAALILIMDARHPLTDFDLRMMEWAGSRSCPVCVLLSKADKLNRGQASATLQRVRRELGPEIAVQLFSATKKTGVEQARDMLASMLGLTPGASKES